MVVVAGGEEDLASSAFYLHRHGLLRSEVEDPHRAGEVLTFCYRCGGYCTDFKPGGVLLERCFGRPASSQVASLIRRIRAGKHPHYRPSTKNLRLSEPRGLSQSERDLLTVRMKPPEQSVAAPGSGGGQSVDRGFASKSDVLRAFGLLESELPQVQALGEAERSAPGESEDEEASDSEGGLF